jgi:hypothetical protein
MIKGNVMKQFPGQKAYLVFTLILSVFISILPGCGSSGISGTETGKVTYNTTSTTPVDLGAAAAFGVFGGGSGMTNQGIYTVVNGDIGTTGASLLITGFHDKGAAVYTETPLNIGTVNGTIHSAIAPSGSDPGVTAAAVALSVQSAFDSLSPAALPGGIDVSSLGGAAGQLGNRTLAPGVYKSAPGTFAIQGGDLTLDAGGDPDAVWVFQMATSLTVGGPGAAFPQSVLLVNGAQARNVFWQVGSSATINAAGGGTMAGTIISSAATTFSTAGNVAVVTLEGRALALNASVTLVNTRINVPSSTVVLNSAKAITAYSLNGVAGTINETAKTISLTMPYGTDVTALAAPFTTTGAIVKVGTAVQTSGLTANNFTGPVTYTVTAADGTAAAYTVTVSVALNSARAITAFSLNGVSGTVNETARTISVTMPKETNVTALIATFTTTGASVKVGTVVQTSGTTANNFTTPATYMVTAADGTTAAYGVTATVAVSAAAGRTPVNLGTAGNFVILAKTGVSTTGTTAVVGNVGVSPVAASYITGFSLIADSTNTFSTSSVVSGKLYASDYAPPTPAVMTTAIGDMQTAFTDAAGRTTPDFTELGAGDISGLTLVPGLYKWGTGVSITNGVTLSGGANDVWIFQVAGDLIVNNSAIVTLTGGAQARNIFWQVSGQANLGTAADFKGIILSQTLISLNTGAKMNGRALAQTAVTLNATAITAP